MSLPSSSAQQLRQDLGNRLRQIRLDAGVSARHLARLMARHSSKISRIEHGHAAPSAADIRSWCKHCGARNQADDLVAFMQTIESMWTEWRRMENAGLRHAQESVLPLYEHTRHFRVYEPGLVPGLLQTPAYTTAVSRAIMRRRSTPDDIDDAVAVRVERQRLLHQGSRRFAFLIEESVLRAGIGGVEVMAAQLGHLLVTASLPGVSLGIVPMHADRDVAWPIEGFWIFDELQVNVELVSGYLTVTHAREIAMYVQAFSALTEVALYGAVARSRITAAIDALGRDLTIA